MKTEKALQAKQREESGTQTQKEELGLDTEKECEHREGSGDLTQRRFSRAVFWSPAGKKPQRKGSGAGPD